MEYIASNNCVITSVTKSPAYIAPGDTVEFAVTVKLNSIARDTINPPIEVGLCKNDGTEFCPLYTYSEKALKYGYSVTINVKATVPAVPQFTDGSGTYAVCVRGTGQNGTEYTPRAANAGTALDERRAPAVTYAFDDSKGYYALCNKYISGYSKLVLNSHCTPDTRDPETKIASRTLTINGRDYSVSSDSEVIATLSASGDVSYTYTVKDNKGGIYSDSGTLPYLAYKKPQIISLSLERYSTSYDEHGDPVYRKDDNSDTVWLNARFRVYPIDGVNEWTFRAQWDGGSSLIDNGSHGDVDVHIVQSREAITAHFDPTMEWPVTFTLRDKITNHRITYQLAKAGAIFSIEPVGGVAVGMRSTADKNNHKFEVDYPTTFYKPVYDADGVELGPVCYTLDERRIGTFDGKPLYRLCLQPDAVATSSNGFIAMGVVPLDIVHIYGFVFSESQGDIPVNCYGGSERMACCIPQRDASGKLTGSLRFWTGAANNGARLFIEFTKQEDADANS